MSDDTPKTDDFETRWPQEGDRLFVESKWAYDAHIICDPEERFYRMPMGFKRAGDILVDQAATAVVHRANVIYPALFCYRQSIELHLKRLIEEFGQGTVASQKNTHDLSILWERFMHIANERRASESIGLSAAQRLVHEMDSADKKSDGFRFPTGTDGKPFLFGGRGIDLDNLREVMQGLENFFECIYLEFLHKDELR